MKSNERNKSPHLSAAEKPLVANYRYVVDMASDAVERTVQQRVINQISSNIGRQVMSTPPASAPPVFDRYPLVAEALQHAQHATEAITQPPVSPQAPIPEGVDAESLRLLAEARENLATIHAEGKQRSDFALGA